MTGFGRILEALNEAGVRYVIVGGIAVIRHGVVRATRDIDALVPAREIASANVRGLMSALRATRPDGSPHREEDLSGRRTLHLHTAHGDLDLMPERDEPLSFDAVAARAQMRRVDGVSALVCSLADLVALKRIAGRERDLVDLSDLAAAHGTLPDSRESD